MRHVLETVIQHNCPFVLDELIKILANNDMVSLIDEYDPLMAFTLAERNHPASLLVYLDAFPDKVHLVHKSKNLLCKAAIVMCGVVDIETRVVEQWMAVVRKLVLANVKINEPSAFNYVALSFTCR